MADGASEHFVIENGRRSLARFLEPLRQLPGVQADELGAFSVSGQSYALPRFIFRGPNASDPIRIAASRTTPGIRGAGRI